LSTLKEIRNLPATASHVIQQSRKPRFIQADEAAMFNSLLEAANQFLDAFARLDETHGETGVIPYDDISELGEHVLSCLSDLGRWSEKWSEPQLRKDFERIALGVAQWIMRHHGELRVLEPIVNAIALQANTTHSQEELIRLYSVINDVLEHTSPALRRDLEKQDSTRPWRILNFNMAIVATRTQDATLIRQAYERLGHNLPEEAPTFFEEGLRQAQKKIYGDEVRCLMQEYFNRWTTRH
jgi:hypothetical protein